jgi:hypothetical protein
MREERVNKLSANTLPTEEDRLSSLEEGDDLKVKKAPFPYMRALGLCALIGVALGLSFAAFRQTTISASPDAYRGDLPLEVAAVHARLELLEREVRTLRETVAKVAPGEEPVHLPTPVGGPVYGLYVASYRAHEAAMAGWETLIARYPGAFANSTPLLLPIETVGGVFVRLIADIGSRDPVPPCDELRQSGLHCKPVRLR